MIAQYSRSLTSKTGFISQHAFGHCPSEQLPLLSSQLCCIWLNMSRKYRSVDFRFHSVPSSVNTSDPEPLETTQAHSLYWPYHVMLLVELSQISCIFFFLFIILDMVHSKFQPVEECNSRSGLTFLIVFMKFGWFLLVLVFLLYKGSWDHTPVAFI